MLGEAPAAPRRTLAGAWNGRSAHAPWLCAVCLPVCTACDQQTLCSQGVLLSQEQQPHHLRGAAAPGSACICFYGPSVSQVRSTGHTSHLLCHSMPHLLPPGRQCLTLLARAHVRAGTSPGLLLDSTHFSLALGQRTGSAIRGALLCAPLMIATSFGP